VFIKFSKNNKLPAFAATQATQNMLYNFNAILFLMPKKKRLDNPVYLQ
jgi:hypothetical protein